MKTPLSLGKDLLYNGILRDSKWFSTFPVCCLIPCIRQRHSSGSRHFKCFLFVLPEDLSLPFSLQVRNRGFLTTLQNWDIFLKILFYHHIHLFWKRLKQKLQLQFKICLVEQCEVDSGDSLVTSTTARNYDLFFKPVHFSLPSQRKAALAFLRNNRMIRLGSTTEKQKETRETGL